MALLELVVSIDGFAASPRLGVERTVHVIFPVALVRGHVPLEASCARVPRASPVRTLTTQCRVPDKCIVPV